MTQEATMANLTTEEQEAEERRKARASWPVWKGLVAESDAERPLARRDRVAEGGGPEWRASLTNGLDGAEEQARIARAAARANWPARKGLLSDLDADEEYADFTPEARVNMMWRITQDAWTVARDNPQPRL